MKIKTIFLFLLIALLLVAGYIVYLSQTPVKISDNTKFIAANQIQYSFSQPNHNINQDLIKVINSSKTSLDIAIYDITKDDIVKAIVNAKIRGVNIRIITDNQEAKSSLEKNKLSVLSRAQIPIKVNTHKGLMHLKMTIADKKIVTTGSYNYTKSATYDNDEVLVIISNSNIAQDWDSKFEDMWNDRNNFSFYR